MRLVMLTLLMLISSCVAHGTRPVCESSPLIMRASWYNMGTITASGKPFNPSALTTAHPSLPFGTKLRLTNPHNQRTVIVTVTDRGPFVKNRELDVSEAAARQLGFLRRGVILLEVCIL